MDKPLPSSWQGQLNLRFSRRLARPSSPGLPSAPAITYPAQSYATAPLKLQRPFYEPDGTCQSVLLHTAGGMVRGDRLNYRIQLDPDTHALVTTAAAAKIYKSIEPCPAPSPAPSPPALTPQILTQQILTVEVGVGACLEWLPQETIVFDGAHFCQEQRIELAPGALWVGWDLTRFGRSARGERFLRGEWRSLTEVWRNGHPLWMDRQWLPASEILWQSPHGLNHCPVIGSFAVVGQEISPDFVIKARSLVQSLGDNTTEKHATEKHTAEKPTSVGYAQDGPIQPHSDSSIVDPVLDELTISRLAYGLVCRYRGHSTTAARHRFAVLWRLVRQDLVQRGLPGQAPQWPRVWPI